jgi:hypothetical protein
VALVRPVIRDGKTGADIFNDIATDKRLSPYLQEEKPDRISAPMQEDPRNSALDGPGLLP